MKIDWVKTSNLNALYKYAYTNKAEEYYNELFQVSYQAKNDQVSYNRFIQSRISNLDKNFDKLRDKYEEQFGKLEVRKPQDISENAQKISEYYFTTVSENDQIDILKNMWNHTISWNIDYLPNPLTLYRAISWEFVPPENLYDYPYDINQQKLSKNNEEIANYLYEQISKVENTSTNLGKFWSLEEERALPYWGSGDTSIVIEAQVDKKYIDLPSTIYSTLLYDNRAREIHLVANAPIHVIKVNVQYLEGDIDYTATVDKEYPIDLKAYASHINWTKVASINDLIKYARVLTVEELFASPKINSIFETAEDLELFMAIDPTFDGLNESKYFRWLLYIYTKEPNFFQEEENPLTLYLDVFSKYNKELPENKRNLNKQIYPTVESLYDIIRDFLPEDNSQFISKSQKKKHIVQNEIVRVYDDPYWKIEHPKTYEATCLLGANTKWCIASNTSSYYYDSYSKQGDIYVITHKKDNVKYAILTNINEFRNPVDEMAYMDWITLYKPQEVAGINNFINSNIKQSAAFDNNKNLKEKFASLVQDRSVSPYALKAQELNSLGSDIAESLKDVLIEAEPMFIIYYNEEDPKSQEFIRSNLGSALAYMKQPTEEQAFTAIKQNPNVIYTGILNRVHMSESNVITLINKDKINTNIGRYIPQSYMTDNVVKALLNHSLENIRYVPENFRTDDLWLKLFNQSPNMYVYMPDHLKTPEASREYLDKYPYHVNDIPKEQQTEEIWLDVISKNPKVIKDVIGRFPKHLRNQEFFNKVMDINPYSIKYVPKKYRPANTQEIWNDFLEKNPTRIRLVPKSYRTEEMWFKALEHTPNVIKYFPKELVTIDLWKEAINRKPELIYNLPYEYRSQEIYNELVALHPKTLSIIPKEYQTDELVSSLNLKNTKFINNITNLREDLQTAEMWQKYVLKNPQSFDKMPSKFISQDFLFALGKINPSVVPDEYQTEENWINYINKFHKYYLPDYIIDSISDTCFTERVVNAIVSIMPYKEYDNNRIKDFLEKNSISETENKQAKIKIDWVTLKSFEDLTIRYGAYFDTITQLKQKYISTGVMTEQQFQQLLDADPTYTGGDKVGSYIPWLLNMFKKDPDDFSFESVKPYIEAYDKAKWNEEFIPKNKQQITSIKSFNELVELTRPLLKKDLRSFNQFKKDVASTPQHVGTWYQVIWYDENYMLIQTNRKEANSFFGKDTSWCTAVMDQKSPHYNEYTHNGQEPLFILIDFENITKYQFNYEDTRTGQTYNFHSSSDAKLSEGGVEKLLKNVNPELKSIIYDIIINGYYPEPPSLERQKDGTNFYFKKEKEKQQKLEQKRLYYQDPANFNELLTYLETLTAHSAHDVSDEVNSCLANVGTNITEDQKDKLLRILFKNTECPRFILFCDSELRRILGVDNIMKEGVYARKFGAMLINEEWEEDALDLMLDSPENFYELIYTMCVIVGNMLINSQRLNTTNQLIIADCITSYIYEKEEFNIFNKACSLPQELLKSLRELYKFREDDLSLLDKVESIVKSNLPDHYDSSLDDLLNKLDPAAVSLQEKKEILHIIVKSRYNLRWFTLCESSISRIFGENPTNNKNWAAYIVSYAMVEQSKDFVGVMVEFSDMLTQCSLEYFLACLDANLTTASDNHEELTKIVMLEAYSVYRINIYNPNTIVPPELVVSLKEIDTNTITYN